MRLFLVALALVYVVGVSYARSIFIGPENCPVAADAPVYVAGAEVKAPDHNPWNSLADETIPVVAIDIADAPQTNRVFAQFTADPWTGPVFGARKRSCGQ